MSERTTLLRSLHDIGAAAWFGGSLMGAIGLNGAAADASEPRDRARLAADGWARWAPVNAVAIGAHLLGGAGVLWENRGRQVSEPGVGANTIVKTVLTVGALGVSGYGAVLGVRIAREGSVVTEGATEPTAETPPAVASAQRQLKVLQWVTPVLTGAIIGLGSQQGEQQRPHGQLRQLLHVA
jgi:hypothetical protein